MDALKEDFNGFRGTLDEVPLLKKDNMIRTIQIFLGFLYFTSFAQKVEHSSIVVEYTTKSIRDITKIESKEAQSIVLETERLMEDFQFELLANKDVALFKMKRKLVGDNISESIYNLAIVSCDGDEVWYVDKANNFKVVEKQGFENQICLTYDQKNLWNIESSQKNIANFSCYKATTVRKEGQRTIEVTAWFTNELPYGFGPLGFDGLPGTILELEFSSIVYSASNVRLNKKERINEPKCSSTQTYDTYFKMMDDRMNTLIKQGD